MRGRRRIPVALPNTGGMYRRKNTICMRVALGSFLFFLIFLQFQVFNFSDYRESTIHDTSTNDSNAAILSMVPSVLHKFLKSKTRNQTYITVHNGTQNLLYNEWYHPPNISEIQKQIYKYNELQLVLNEDAFGPLQNDSVIIVVQVHNRITYLRHLIVSLAQAKDISRTLLIFSHDYYDEDINDLVQSIDFCKVMQIFYPHSIQTHPHEFPGVDPGDCPRDLKKEKALIKKCNNAQYPDLYGHYREASFTQTKHHWWWKANRVFDQLEVTRYHTGLVLFLEEDHYVAEDFLYVLELMHKRALQLCRQCNILSLGTYLKTFNYYTYNSRVLPYRELDFNKRKIIYSYDQVEVMSWISSQHNMGFSFNRTTWKEIKFCAQHFCNYDDYNWDWSLQHLSQQCLKHKLHAMIVKGPRVFHIGECGIHHKKQNCESNQVISKVQQVLRIANKSGQMFPKKLTLTVASLIKRTKLRKGNGGWGDKRDHYLCLNMTLITRAAENLEEFFAARAEYYPQF